MASSSKKAKKPVAKKSSKPAPKPAAKKLAKPVKAAPKKAPAAAKKAPAAIKKATVKPAPKEAPKATAKAAGNAPSYTLPVNKEKEAALKAASKVAAALAEKSDKALTAEKSKKDTAPIDPKEAARAIRKIKASFFASMATSSAPTAVTSSTESPFQPRVQALIDKQEIADLVYSYARAIDRSEENLLRSIFHPDATVDFGSGIFQGTVADFIGWALDVRKGMKATQHMISNVRCDLRGDTAFVETYFLAWHRIEKSTGKEDYFLGGRYLDRLERRPTGSAGVWKIIHRKQVKDWTRTMPVAELFYHLNPDALWASQARTDPSYQMESFPSSTAAKPPVFGRRYDSKSVKL